VETRALAIVWRSGTRALFLYVAAIAAAEVCFVFVDVALSVFIHALLVLGLVNHYLAAKQPGRPTSGDVPDAFLVLSLVPLLRIFSVVMPVREVAEIYRYALVGVPLLIAAAVVATVVGAKPLVASLRRWSWRAQGSIALSGIPLSLAAFVIARPDPIIDGLDWERLLLGSVILLVFSGFAEEVIFRGLVQRSVSLVFGRGSVVWSTLLFTIVYIGASPPVYILFVAVLGLAFGWFVARTRSLLGVGIAHGLLNVGLILVWPGVLG
jgi:membrane protease YdiL (CAAX protease family)